MKARCGPTCRWPCDDDYDGADGYDVVDDHDGADGYNGHAMWMHSDGAISYDGRQGSCSLRLIHRRGLEGS